MQLNECNYCGVSLDATVFKCSNCGGLVKQSPATKPKTLYKKRIATLVLLIITISPIIYKIHLDNTATAVVAKLQANTGTGNDATINSDDFLIKAKFTQALVNLTPIKVYSVEFLMSEGRYPGTLQALGFNPQSFDTGEYIQAVQLSNNGTIRADLAPAVFGKQKFFTLTPKEIMGGMNIQWSCLSNLQPNLLPTPCQSTT